MKNIFQKTISLIYALHDMLIFNPALSIFPHILISITIIICSIFFIQTPIAAAAELGKCSCSGNISVKSELFKSTFDGYCPDFADYCTSCGDGQATCSIDFSETQEACQQINTNPERYFQSIGVPETAISSLNFGGSCNWTAQAQLKEGGTPTAGGAKLEFPPPLGTTDVRVIIARIISVILGVVGSIALLMFIIAGFMWLTAGGSADRIEKAKNILIWSTLGLVVIFSAYAMTQLIITAILEGGT